MQRFYFFRFSKLLGIKDLSKEDVLDFITVAVLVSVSLFGFTLSLGS